MDTISYGDFQKLDIKVGTVKSAENHPKADKLYILKIDFGDCGERQIVAGMKPYYTIKEITGKKIIAILNLEPRELRGDKSNGMILAAEDGKGCVALLGPLKDIDNGSKVC
jgi:methionyl-tRNA synthetase